MSRAAGSALRNTRPMPPKWLGGLSASGRASIRGWWPKRLAGCSAFRQQFAIPQPARPIAGASRRGFTSPPMPMAAGSASACYPRSSGLLERQGYVVAVGAIALPNDASVRLHEALGFVHAGTYRGTGFKLGQWIDVGLWQKELAPRSPAPAEPLPFCFSRCAGISAWFAPCRSLHSRRRSCATSPPSTRDLSQGWRACRR